MRIPSYKEIKPWACISAGTLAALLCFSECHHLVIPVDRALERSNAKKLKQLNRDTANKIRAIEDRVDFTGRHFQRDGVGVLERRNAQLRMHQDIKECDRLDQLIESRNQQIRDMANDDDTGQAKKVSTILAIALLILVTLGLDKCLPGPNKKVDNDANS